ncbi:MAG: diphosphomevalonate decarboxylase [Anaerolineales bacterium]|nr:diphosphomevalonate decarboxylase [Anaerolineales bacterium]MCX7756332.1 diphosphomevalonate decarboxylase [Anaerolineales bacterium]MDW8279337.1 diphosphomevalonate decarboxylase [Anaerolineales bacterium]
MTRYTATALAHPNIAFIKYWGNRDAALRLPVNGSISMNLEGLFTRTTVSFQPSLAFDELVINGREVTGPGLERVSGILEVVRQAAGIPFRAEVLSETNFPTGAGIASSASAFAALALAAVKAAGLSWSESAISRLARRGSGSACRSIPGGFVEWQMGAGDDDSFAVSIAPPSHWDLADCVAVVSSGHKATGSTEGHALAPTSPLQSARVADAPRRLEICRRAILERDFGSLSAIIELDSDMMHAVMMTGQPALFYWKPATLAVMEAVRAWRRDGLQAAYTVDAGPNVHVICPQSEMDAVTTLLREIPGVTQVLRATVGGPARLF